MSDRSLRKVISTYLHQAAYSLLSCGTNLSKDDVKKLREKGPKLAKKVRESGKNSFKRFSDNDKRLLLAYVVYFRQNLAMDGNVKPNDEDAAKILKGEVFKGDDKETKERMVEELVRQLQKAGMKIDDK
jgi:hypothetical protein